MVPQYRLIFMSKTSASVVIDYQLLSGFNDVREKLLSLRSADHLDKPLAYWAQATDRHLPIALVNKTLRYMVETPFQQISQTPGVGPKKLSSLIALMWRAAEGTTAGDSAGLFHFSEAQPSDPSHVSEAVWCQWRASLRNQRLEKEMLGRFAASLQQLPRSMWRKRLEDYLPLSLRQIRALKGHGEKRVAALLEVVGGLHSIVEQLKAQPHLSARIEPRLSARLENWFQCVSVCRGLLKDSTVCQELFEPLLGQVEIDIGEHAADILRERLLGRRLNVQQMARRLGLTRGRVYEIMSEAAIAIAVRWPQGRRRFMELRNHLASYPERRLTLSRVETALALLFPDRGIDSEPEPEAAATAPLALPLSSYSGVGASVAPPDESSFLLAEVDG